MEEQMEELIKGEQPYNHDISSAAHIHTGIPIGLELMSRYVAAILSNSSIIDLQLLMNPCNNEFNKVTLIKEAKQLMELTLKEYNKK